MPGDYSRKTFDRKKHYRGVLMQQGRVQLDADWNEQLAIHSKFTGSTSRNIIYLAFSMDYGSRGKIMEFTRNIST